jgi:glutaredoxin 3
MEHVTIYTRSFCIWCFRAKWLLRAKGIAFEERDARSETVRAQLLAQTGRKTVPQIFFGPQHVGGFEDLRARLAAE